MAATVQVILQEDVTNVGASGELVKVRPGFARNYLLPRSLAVPATVAQVNRLNHDKQVALAKNEKSKKEAKDLADKIQGITISLTRPGGEDGRLFGSVTTKDIHAALLGKGVDVDRKKMHLPEAIKHVGSFEVAIKLVTDVTATLKVEVVKGEGGKK